MLHERIGAMRILHADIRDTIGNLLHRVSASDKAIRFFSKTLTESPYERPSASECLEMGWVSGKDDAGGDNADVFVDTIAVTDDQRCQLSASPSPGTTDSSDEHTL